MNSAFEHIREPGGFRRNYVMMRANEQGLEEPIVSNNFIEFLYLFGHFVSGLGSEHILPEYKPYERLGKILRKKKRTRMNLHCKRKVLWRGHHNVSRRKCDNQCPSNYYPSASRTQRKPDEREPLLPKKRGSKFTTMSRRRRQSVGPRGDATVTQAVLMVSLFSALVAGVAYVMHSISFSSHLLVLVSCFLGKRKDENVLA